MSQLLGEARSGPDFEVVLLKPVEVGGKFFGVSAGHRGRVRRDVVVKQEHPMLLGICTLRKQEECHNHRLTKAVVSRLPVRICGFGDDAHKR